MAPSTASAGTLGVLASGSGSILEAICEAGLPVGLVVTDRACGALDIAAGRGIGSRLVERDRFDAGFDRHGYTARLVEVLRAEGVETIAMAGFMTVLGSHLFEVYGGRVLNTHPSLLPAFPGAHAVRDALAYGVKVTGCTVHQATELVDHGPILAQEAVPVVPADDEASLHERIKAVERRLYPATIAAFLASG